MHNMSPGLVPHGQSGAGPTRASYNLSSPQRRPWGRHCAQPAQVFDDRINVLPHTYSMTAYLVIREGSKWTDVFRLVDGESVTVGRAPTNEIVIKDERCSRNHAEVFQSARRLDAPRSR